MQTKRFSTTETIMGLIFMAAIVWFIFFLFKSIYSILALAAPFLIIAALVINRKVVLSYGKMVLGLLQKIPSPEYWPFYLPFLRFHL